MAVLLDKIKDTYDYIFYELADERTKDLFPAGWVMLTLLPFYIYFSLRLGPRLMRDLKPFELRNIIFYYNLFQIYICAHAFYLGIKGGWLKSYNFTCQPVDTTENPESRTMLNGVWLYTQIKLIDLMDTVFFVLRKKDRQISTLHVFHHSIMPVASFIGLKYYPNGHGTFVGMINCLIHVVMYTYYLISGLGTEYKKYLWWKKHLTSMQIVQFGIVFIHNFVAVVNTSCDYPKWISCLLMINSSLFVYMFGKFYYENYVKKSRKVANGIANNTTKFSHEHLKVQ